LLDLQVMLADECEKVFNVVAGVDDHGFARSLVADDRAVALQRPDREDFVDHASLDHGSIVASREYLVPGTLSRVPTGEN
jgi:hypothetical protein